MKCATLGFEGDQMHGGTVTVTYPVLNDITILGYQFDLGLMAWDSGGIFNTSGWSEVLFTLHVPQLQVFADFGPGVFTDSTGTSQNLHGNNIDNNNICRSIVKGFIGDQSAVNKSIVVTNLSIKIPKGSSLVFTGTHAGAGPIDFEFQGCIYYD